RDSVLTETLERLTLTAKDHTPAAVLEEAIPLIGRGIQIDDTELRTKAAKIGIQIIRRAANAKYSALLATLEHTLAESWEAMDDNWSKVDAAFQITSGLALCCREVAIEYLGKAERLRDAVALESPNVRYD